MRIGYGRERFDIWFNHPVEAVTWLEANTKVKTPDKHNRRDDVGSYGWDDRPNAENGRYYHNQTSTNGYETWAGIKQLAYAGWQVGTDDITMQVANIKHAEEEMLTGYRFDVTGQFFDVGLVVAGEPECWFEQETEPVKKVVSICVNIAASGDVSADKLSRRGAAVLALIDRLQECGYIVELTVFIGAEKSNKTAYAWFEFGTTPLDIDAVSLVLAHPGFFRVAGFAVIECGNGGCPGECYCKDLSREEKDRFNIYIPSGDLRNSDGRGLQTASDAAEWVQGKIASLADMEL